MNLICLQIERHFSFVSFSGAAFLFAWILSPVAFPQVRDLQELKEQAYASVPEELEILYERKAEPKQGDWLAHFKEPGQSFDEYRLRDALTLPNNKRTRIVIQPLGAWNNDQIRFLEYLREYSEAFFQTSTRVAPNIELQSAQLNNIERRTPNGDSIQVQWDASLLISKILVPWIPDDAAIYVGVTMEDLFVPDLNYVFGLGAFDRRCGVYSLVRYFPEFWGKATDAESNLLALRRSFKVLNHEASHVLGMRHCIFYECSLNGSNSLAETDRNSIHECPLCHRKLQWTLKFDPKRRLEALKRVYSKHGMQEEMEWIERRLQVAMIAR